MEGRWFCKGAQGIAGAPDFVFPKNPPCAMEY